MSIVKENLQELLKVNIPTINNHNIVKYCIIIVIIIVMILAMIHSHKNRKLKTGNSKVIETTFPINFESSVGGVI